MRIAIRHGVGMVLLASTVVRELLLALLGRRLLCPDTVSGAARQRAYIHAAPLLLRKRGCGGC